MSPFLRAVVRTFPWCLGSLGALALLLGLASAPKGDVPWAEGLYITWLSASGLAVFVGGIRGLKLQHAGRVVGKDAPWRADRVDVGLVGFLVFSMVSLGFVGAFRGGEIVSVVGGLLGFWLASTSSLSLVLIGLVVLWTFATGELALFVHQQPLLDIWKLELASLSAILAAAAARALLVVSGPPGWLRAFLTFATVLLPPLAFGLFTPAHELSSKTGAKSLADEVLPFLLPVAVLLSYQWLCVSRPTPEGRPAEATQSGCGCTFFGVGVFMVALDSVGGTMLGLPLEARVAIFGAVVVGCALGAVYASRQARGRYQALTRPRC